jgi:hypothetical protein
MSAVAVQMSSQAFPPVDELPAALTAFLTTQLSARPHLSLRQLLFLTAQEHGEAILAEHTRAAISHAVTAIVQSSIQARDMKGALARDGISSGLCPHLDTQLHPYRFSIDSSMDASGDAEASAAAAAESQAAKLQALAAGMDAASIMRLPQAQVRAAPEWEAELYERGANGIIAQQTQLQSQLSAIRRAVRPPRPKPKPASQTLNQLHASQSTGALGADGYSPTLRRTYTVQQPDAGRPPSYNRAHSFEESPRASPSPSQMDAQPPTEEAADGGAGFNKLITISDALCSFMHLPSGSQASRTQVVRAISAYVAEHGLQDPKDRRTILCDSTLSQLLGVPSCNFFQVHRYISPHFAKTRRSYKKRSNAHLKTGAAAAPATAAAGSTVAATAVPTSNSSTVLKAAAAASPAAAAATSDPSSKKARTEASPAPALTDAVSEAQAGEEFESDDGDEEEGGGEELVE